MTDLLDVLAPPPERELPTGRLELHRAALMRTVEADLRAAVSKSAAFAVLRSVRAWLMIVALVVVLAVGAEVGSARASGPPTSPQEVVAVAVAVAAPVVGSLAVAALARSELAPVSRYNHRDRAA